MGHVLKAILQIRVLLGLTIATYGFSYSALALDILYGGQFSEDSGQLTIFCKFFLSLTIWVDIYAVQLKDTVCFLVHCAVYIEQSCEKLLQCYLKLLNITCYLNWDLRISVRQSCMHLCWVHICYSDKTGFTEQQNSLVLDEEGPPCPLQDSKGIGTSWWPQQFVHQYPNKENLCEEMGYCRKMAMIAEWWRQFGRNFFQPQNQY